jgi:hypothetical protein
MKKQTLLTVATPRTRRVSPSPEKKGKMKTTGRLIPGFAILLVALGLTAGAYGYGVIPGQYSVEYAQACDGQLVTLTVTYRGLTPNYSQLAVGVGRAISPFDSLGFAPSVTSDASGIATVVFTGLPASTSVFTTILDIGPGGGPFGDPVFTTISCTPQAQLSSLVDLVLSLNASDGITNSLDAKLSHIQDALAAARNSSLTVACNSLDAFVHEVAAQAQNGAISQTQATALTNTALSIMKALGCP